MKVGVFGAGNMGAALVKALCKADFEVSVWNRTKEKALALTDSGAVVSTSINAAISENKCLVFSLANYTAAQTVLDSFRASLDGKSVIQLTTGEPSEARAMSESVERAGGQYLDGAIMGFPNHVGSQANAVLYSGDRSVLDTHQSLLDAIGTVSYYGEDPGAASAFDIACLMPIITMTAGLLQGIKVCEAEGLDPARYDEFLRNWMPLILNDSLAKYRTDGYAQDSEKAECTIGLMATITDLFSRYCDGNDIDPIIFAALRKLFESGVRQGLQAHDWVNIGSLRVIEND